MKINIKYLSVFFILFMIEVIIALFIKDKVIRPFIGDILVIILMYTFIKGVIAKPVKYLPLGLFIFASGVETAQYFRIVEILNLQHNKFASIVIGTTFDFKDILCYFAAMVILMVWEKIQAKKSKNGEVSAL